MLCILANGCPPVAEEAGSRRTRPRGRSRDSERFGVFENQLTRDEEEVGRGMEVEEEDEEGGEGGESVVMSPAGRRWGRVSTLAIMRAGRSHTRTSTPIKLSGTSNIHAIRA
jgi:hypothetical protein